MTTQRELSPTAQRFETLVNSGKLSQKEIADKLNYTKPNIITMFKQGQTKIPIDKIPAIARIFNIDASELLKMAMEEYEPKKYKAIVEILGEPISDYERKLLKVIRDKVDESELRHNTTHYINLIKRCMDEDQISRTCL